MNQDIENAVKATQAADMLCSDLRDMVRSENLLLSRMATEVLGEAAKVRNRISDIASDLVSIDLANTKS